MRFNSLDRGIRPHADHSLAARVSPAVRYLAAVGCVAVALLGRWMLDPLLGELQPLSLLFGAVALTVWLGGYRPALVAMLLGYLGADYLFTEPRGEIAIQTTQQFINLVTYLLSSLIVIGFGEALRRASARSQSYARQLEQHKAALERMDRRKDHFLATIAHELRNPLSAVTNVAQVLQRRAATYPQISEACKILDRQTAHAVRLVDDLLDISRVRSGKIHLKQEALQIREVIGVAADSVRPSALAAGQTLEIEEADSSLVVYGDFARLTQVFANLLSNAVRYTPRGGSIRVTCRREGSHSVIVVRDTGMGIPEHMLERIFEMFEQADTAIEHSQSGLGIGLALVRKLLALHNGEVKADSAGIGLGSQFTVRLPAVDRGEHAAD